MLAVSVNRQIISAGYDSTKSVFIGKSLVAIGHWIGGKIIFFVESITLPVSMIYYLHSGFSKTIKLP